MPVLDLRHCRPFPVHHPLTVKTLVYSPLLPLRFQAVVGCALILDRGKLVFARANRFRIAFRVITSQSLFLLPARNEAKRYSKSYTDGNKQCRIDYRVIHYTVNLKSNFTDLPCSSLMNFQPDTYILFLRRCWALMMMSSPSSKSLELKSSRIFESWIIEAGLSMPVFTEGLSNVFTALDSFLTLGSSLEREVKN